MDTDWCLSCGRRVDGAAPYCSRECLSYDDPSPLNMFANFEEPLSESASSSSQEHTEFEQFEPTPAPTTTSWVTIKGPAGIAAWAADIPLGAPAGAPASPIAITPTRIRSPLVRSPKSNSPASPTLRPPVLLLPHHRPTPPTLCMSTPHTTLPYPSLPVLTPQQHVTLAALGPADSVSPSMGKTSLLSARTESLVATPSSPLALALPSSAKPSVLGALATHVRSWVSPSPQPLSPQHRKRTVPPPRANSTAPAPIAKRSPLASADSSLTSSLASSPIDEPPAWWVSSPRENHSSTESLLKECLSKELACATRGRRGSRQVVA
jgi:hypothetical protein